jgi:hypothetical protein
MSTYETPVEACNRRLAALISERTRALSVLDEVKHCVAAALKDGNEKKATLAMAIQRRQLLTIRTMEATIAALAIGGDFEAASRKARADAYEAEDAKVEAAVQDALEKMYA